MDYAFDIETDGLLREEPGRARIMSKVHCLCLTEIKGDFRTIRFHDHPKLAKDGSIEEGLSVMDTADMLVGHGALDFDFPALERQYGWVPSETTVKRDTLVMARLQFPWIKDLDFRDKGMPKDYRGSHKLAAWGWRLGKQKGDFSDRADKDPDLWLTLTQDMLDYNALDTQLTALLWQTLARRKWPNRSVDLEHRFASRISSLMHTGVAFNLDEAERLAKELAGKRADGRIKLAQVFGDRVVEWTTPVRKEKKSKTVPVNVGSQVQVAEALGRLYGWKPTKFTPSGLPQMDESVVSDMDETVVPKEVKAMLLDDAILEKVLGQLASGRNPWIKVAREVDEPTPHHRIFYYVNHNGAWTGRCTHRTVVNVPRVTTPYGKELRSLFTATPGGMLVGGDIKSGEACIIAHLLVPYDGGKFLKRIVSGEDVHTENWKRCADLIPSRQEAKNVLYACAYGAQDKKVGAMLGVGPVKGGRVRSAILAAVPGLEPLFEARKEQAAQSGYLIGLDGRKIRPRAAYGALNTEVQNYLGIVMKLATDLACAKLEPVGGRLVLHYHDEYQFDVPAGVDIEWARGVLSWAIEEAARKTGIRCPMTGDTKAGPNWAATH